MRADVAVKILAAIGVLWALVAIVQVATGDPGSERSVRSLAAGILIIGGVFAAGYVLRARPARRAFETEARRLGFAKTSSGDPLAMGSLGFALFGRPAAVRAIESTAWGCAALPGAVLVDYWYAASGRRQIDDYRRFSCLIAPSGAQPVANVPPPPQTAGGDHASGFPSGVEVEPEEGRMLMYRERRAAGRTDLAELVAWYRSSTAAGR